MAEILFETYTGSNLYGTTTPESDLDIKRVVLPDLSSLLLGESIGNKVTKSEKLDLEEIPIQIFARDFLAGQTYALELAWAVKYDKANQHIYNKMFIDFCAGLRCKFLTSNISAMVGYAVNQAKLYSDKGNRLNAAIAINELLSSFPAEDTVVKHIKVFEQLVKEIETVYPLAVKLSEYAIDSTGQTLKPCLILLEKILPYTCTFGTLIEIVRAQINKFGTRTNKAALSTANWKATAHAIRICDEGIDLLSGKELVFPYPEKYINYLLKIRTGKFDINIIRTIIERKVDILKRLSLESKLPSLTPEIKIKLNKWLLPWLYRFYNLN